MTGSPVRRRRHQGNATPTFRPADRAAPVVLPMALLRIRCDVVRSVVLMSSSDQSFRATSGPVIRFRSWNVEAVIASEATRPPNTGGSATFSSGVSSGPSWPDWKTNPNALAQRASFPFAHRVDTVAVETDLTGVGDEDARQAVKQRRFAPSRSGP